MDLNISDKQKLKELAEDEKAGLLLAGANAYINENLQAVLNAGIKAEHIYVLDEFNKSRISYKLTTRTREKFSIEINLADHCNMNCQMCDHYSQLSEPHFLSVDSFTHDMERLSFLFKKKLGLISLLGGEPLLNENLPEFVKIARRCFPETYILIFTNGILLKSWEAKGGDENRNLWQVCHDNNIVIRMTVYPNMVKAVDEIIQLGRRYDVLVDLLVSPGDRSYNGLKRSMHYPLDFEGKAVKYGFICCYQFNECRVLRDGKIYPCPMAAYVDIFNKYFNKDIVKSPKDCIDIYQVNSWQEIVEFSTNRIPFCDYCKVLERNLVDWAQSSRSIEEYS